VYCPPFFLLSFFLSSRTSHSTPHSTLVSMRSLRFISCLFPSIALLIAFTTALFAPLPSPSWALVCHRRDWHVMFCRHHIHAPPRVLCPHGDLNRTRHLPTPLKPCIALSALSHVACVPLTPSLPTHSSLSLTQLSHLGKLVVVVLAAVAGTATWSQMRM
jgi:hypothetical protein